MYVIFLCYTQLIKNISMQYLMLYLIITNIDFNNRDNRKKKKKTYERSITHLFSYFEFVK